MKKIQLMNNIDIDHKEVTIEFESYESPPIKKPKIEIQSVQKVPVKILNSNYESTPKTLPTQSSSTSVVKSIVKSGNQSYTIRKISPAKQRTKPEETQNNILSTVQILDMNDDKDLYQNMVLIEPEQQEVKEESLSELKPLLEQSLRESAAIKQLLKQKLTSTPTQNETPTKSNDTSSISKSHMNKTQLFNGIKRYLSPSLTALLRMELFGAPSREYTNDEKIICTEILQLGDDTYNFLAEEWRLRLPAIDKVKDWMKQGDLDEIDEN
jgi:hypothetical protein